MTNRAEIESLTALAESTRLRIAVLLSLGELCVCELVEILSLPQSTVSRHMARLRRAGLVADRKDGKWVHYRLNERSGSFSSELTALLPLLRDQEPYRSDFAKLTRRNDRVIECGDISNEK